MLNMKNLVAVLLFCLASNTAFSQLGFSHEVGIIAGPVSFRSDFGERFDFDTNIGNTGIGIGLVHYINFAYRADCNCYSTDNYFNDHFKLRTELSWNKTNLKHYGKWVEDSRNTPNANKLRAHEGVANNFDIGMQIEYFPLSIRQFQAYTGGWAPFISAGVHYVSFNPKASTNYFDPNTGLIDGNIENANNFYSRWEPGSIDVEGGTTWSVVASVGTRYKISPLSDLMVDLRWQTYFNNKIDGLDHQLSSNKFNDWLVWLNFGYIYYLD